MEGIPNKEKGNGNKVICKDNDFDISKLLENEGFLKKITDKTIRNKMARKNKKGREDEVSDSMHSVKKYKRSVNTNADNDNRFEKLDQEVEEGPTIDQEIESLSESGSCAMDTDRYSENKEVRITRVESESGKKVNDNISIEYNDRLKRIKMLKIGKKI